MNNRGSEPVIIVGGGIIGLSLAWYLGREGRAVTILERGIPGNAASHAAAGMLAPQIESEPAEEPLLPLLLAARNEWPSFAAALTAVAGKEIGYRQEGTLVVALHRDETVALHDRFTYLQALGCTVEWCDAQTVRTLEPALHHRVQGGILSRDDHQVDNRLVVQALQQACRQANVIFRENTSVHAVATGKVTLENGDTLAASHIVIAAGAWSGSLLSSLLPAPPVLRPVKGQMLALQMPKNYPLLRHVVWGEKIYLVPRNDGRLLVGATVEEQGFDTHVTAGGMRLLLQEAWQTLPGIEELPVVETWAGLRPGSFHDAPFLGASGVEGISLATGHYRNGILLAPLTARVMRDYILHGNLPDIARPYTLCASIV